MLLTISPFIAIDQLWEKERLKIMQKFLSIIAKMSLVVLYSQNKYAKAIKHLVIKAVNGT